MSMGRNKSVHTDLPPRMVARTLKSGKRLFYYNGKRRVPLGSDLNVARLEWAKLENNGEITQRFPRVAEQYERAIVPTLRQSTQAEYRRALRNLCKAFAEFTLEQIRPADVKQYMTDRKKKISAIREKSVLSALFKWSRESGLINAPNPCQGVGFSRYERQSLQITGKRDRYVTDEEYQAVWEKAPQFVQDAMDLCLLTGQRLGDVLRWTRQNVKDGVLTLRQSKTGTDVGIRIEGELKAVLERIQGRLRMIQTMHLVADDKGQRIRQARVYYAFIKSKGDADWQMRDLRAKAASDSPDLATAKGLLGHSSEQTTALVYRRSKGNVGPLK